MIYYYYITVGYLPCYALFCHIMPCSAIICLVLLCFAGYYCTGGSEEPEPVSQTYGDICPPGYYCPNGTHTPEACPSGTFLISDTMGSVDDCTPCSPGK